MTVPPQPRRLPDPEAVMEIFPPGVLSGKDANPDALVRHINETVLRSLPNEVTRMLYLASLRDCNSGLYLHSELSQQNGLHPVDAALRFCHEQVFRRLLTLRLPDYVNQLQEYIRYTRSEADTVLKTWKSLQAYRATVPVAALPLSAELFFLNIAIALEILANPEPWCRHA
jgi:hypothetical protein